MPARRPWPDSRCCLFIEDHLTFCSVGRRQAPLPGAGALYIRHHEVAGVGHALRDGRDGFRTGQRLRGGCSATRRR